MTDSELYPLYRYDDTYHLKVPPLLWLVMFFGLRHLAVHGLQILQVVGGDWAELIYDWRFLIGDAAALVVLICAGFRVPEAPALVRRIWHSGRALLLASYGLEILWLIVLYREEIFVSPYHLPTFAGILVVDVLIILYLATSRLVRDVFADFPAPKKA